MADPTTRVFVYDGREHPDPDPSLSVDDVRKNFANFFPELANAKHTGPETVERDGVNLAVHTFQKTVGTKGRSGIEELADGLISVLLPGSKAEPEQLAPVAEAIAELIDRTTDTLDLVGAVLRGERIVNGYASADPESDGGFYVNLKVEEA